MPSQTTRLGHEITGQLSRGNYGMKFNQALGSGNMLVAEKVKLNLDISAAKQAKFQADNRPAPFSDAGRPRPHRTMTITDHLPAESLTDQELASWLGMLQVHAAVTQALDAQMHAEHGLPVSSSEVLMFLGDAPDRRMRMSDIADRVLLSRSGLTRLAD